MSHDTHDNSRLSWAQLQDSLGERQLQIYNIIHTLNCMGTEPTNDEILTHLRVITKNDQLQINNVTGRVRELLDQKLIKETGNKKGPTGKPRRTVAITNRLGLTT